MSELKHDELLALEKKLKTEYIEISEALENDDVDVSLSTLSFRQKRLDEIEMEAKKYAKITCKESKEYGGCNAHDFNPEHWLFEAQILEKMQENDFVKRFWSYYARDGDPLLDYEEPSFYWVDPIEKLKKAFMMYDAYRQAFIYKDLVFINSTVGGGWEAWTLKRFGDQLIPFESISMQSIIRDGKTHEGLTFEQYIEKLNNLTREQVIHYLEMV